MPTREQSNAALYGIISVLKNPVAHHFRVKILDKYVSKDQKPSDFKDKNKGVINRIKKIFLQIINVIVEVFSSIVANIIG